MKFKGIVFDLDGTLLDSLLDIGTSMNAALRSRGFPEHPIADYKIHVGDGMATLARRVLPEGKRDEPGITELVAGMREEYGRRWAESTRPYPGVPELLDELTKRGLKLSIVSNKPHDFSQQVAARLLPQWHFDPVIGARSGIPHKPDPANALDAAAQMKLTPAECAFMGDTHADMRTAVSAGMFPAGALWGFREAPELLEAGAKVLLKHPMDFLQLLD
jgi:phosphoglycolate phosphatase